MLRPPRLRVDDGILCLVEDAAGVLVQGVQLGVLQRFCDKQFSQGLGTKLRNLEIIFSRNRVFE